MSKEVTDFYMVPRPNAHYNWCSLLRLPLYEVSAAIDPGVCASLNMNLFTELLRDRPEGLFLRRGELGSFVATLPTVFCFVVLDMTAVIIVHAVEQTADVVVGKNLPIHVLRAHIFVPSERPQDGANIMRKHFGLALDTHGWQLVEGKFSLFGIATMFRNVFRADQRALATGSAVSQIGPAYGIRFIAMGDTCCTLGDVSNTVRFVYGPPAHRPWMQAVLDGVVGFNTLVAVFQMHRKPSGNQPPPTRSSCLRRSALGVLDRPVPPSLEFFDAACGSADETQTSATPIDKAHAAISAMIATRVRETDAAPYSRDCAYRPTGALARRPRWAPGPPMFTPTRSGSLSPMDRVRPPPRKKHCATASTPLILQTTTSTWLTLFAALFNPNPNLQSKAQNP